MSVRCVCGRLHVSSTDKIRACRCGTRVAVKAETPKPDLFGKSFRSQWPEMFSRSKNCRCSEAIAILNQYGKDSIKHSKTISRLLGQPISEIENAIHLTQYQPVSPPA